MKFHFTDRLPPREMLSDFPNWQIGAEGRPGCHEGTIWNAGPYKFINHETNLTAGDVFYADGSSSMALIGVTDNESTSWATDLRIYCEDGFWRLDHEGYDSLTAEQGIWVSPKFPSSQQLDVTNAKLFPLRYCTHLRSAITRKTVSGGIALGGSHFDWDAWSLYSPPRKKKTKKKQ